MGLQVASTRAVQRQEHRQLQQQQHTFHLGSLKVHRCRVLRGHLCLWWWRECLPIIYSLLSYLKCHLTALNAFGIQNMQKTKHFVSWMTPCWDDKWSQRTTFQDTRTASRKIFPCTVRLASRPSGQLLSLISLWHHHCQHHLFSAFCCHLSPSIFPAPSPTSVYFQDCDPL